MLIGTVDEIFQCRFHQHYTCTSWTAFVLKIFWPKIIDWSPLVKYMRLGDNLVRLNFKKRKTFLGLSIDYLEKYILFCKLSVILLQITNLKT